MDIDFNKYPDKLVPAVIQDSITRSVLMLGYMNEEAYLETVRSRKVTFYSRSKQRLWTKGETSGNFLELEHLYNDCDNDALLILVRPKGPVCHKGTDTCWGQENKTAYGFLSELEKVIASRSENRPEKGSYVSSLFEEGVNKIAQKVGEEAVEVVIEAMDDNDHNFVNESADLLFHFLILLKSKGCRLDDIVGVLENRHTSS